MKVSIGVSNHHVHLMKEDLEILFGREYELTKRNDLKQYGEFASEEVVSLKTDKGIIDNVRIIGPLRNYTQVEVLKSDCNILGINPPVRNSGDLKDSENIIIIGPNGELKKENVCIIANRHIHINSNDGYKYKDNQIVEVVTNDGRVLDNVHIKISSNYYFEMHIDKDDAIKFNLKNGDLVTIMDGD